MRFSSNWLVRGLNLFLGRAPVAPESTVAAGARPIWTAAEKMRHAWPDIITIRHTINFGHMTHERILETETESRSRPNIGIARIVVARSSIGGAQGCPSRYETASRMYWTRSFEISATISIFLHVLAQLRIAGADFEDCVQYILDAVSTWRGALRPPLS